MICKVWLWKGIKMYWSVSSQCSNAGREGTVYSDDTARHGNFLISILTTIYTTLVTKIKPYLPKTERIYIYQQQGYHKLKILFVINWLISLT